MSTPLPALSTSAQGPTNMNSTSASFVSAQGSYMSQVLSTIVEKFTESRLPPKTIPGYPPVKRTVVKDRLHFALRYILKLFPACEPLLQGQMGNHYPSSADTSEVHLEYVDNLLRLREYTNLGRDILELVTLKCCELDIEMQLDLQDDSDETVQQIMQDIAATEAQLAEREATSAGGLDSDEEDEEDSDVESIMSDESDLEEIARIAKIRNKIQSMDAILDRLFSLYDRELSSDLSSADASDCFENILADFVNIILIRYKSRHSQFVIFWAAQKSPEFTSRFIGCLLDIIITDSSRTALDKQTAVAFLTGFVARAAKVNGEDVRLVFTCLLDYIEYFRKQYEQSALGPDLTRYPVFYALFQGLLYTFCFRWRDLVMVEEGSFVDPDDMATYRRAELTWVDGLQGRIKACVHSKLNPLKVCAPAIVQEFARLAHALNLIYVYPRLEQNKSISLSAVAHATPSGMFRDTGTFHEERSTPLQADFPFDPYQLPVSKRWLEQEHVYISWDSLPDPADRRQTHGDQDTDDDEEEEEDDDDDEEQNGDLESEAYDS